MQKYTNDKEIRYFEDDVIVEDWINLKEYRLMTDEEILKHESPTEIIESKYFKPLSKRQFNLFMYDKGLLGGINEFLESDPRIKLEFDSTYEIYRDSETVKLACEYMKWTNDEVDTMWQEALKL